MPMKAIRMFQYLCMLALFLQLSFFSGCSPTSEKAVAEIDYESFLKNHDMLWDSIPNNWLVAPYTGNGNIGFLFYQQASEGKNTLSILTGRSDYYDQRLPYKGKEVTWIYRGRLPLGHFTLESRGDILSTELRLDLWNAELTGTVKTTEGEYHLQGLTHSENDVIYFETDASEGESVKISWLPEVPYSELRARLEKRTDIDHSRNPRLASPYPLPPEPEFSEFDGMQFCHQPLYAERGEITTAWEISGEQDGKQVLTSSIHFSFPEHNSLETARENLLEAREMFAEKSFFSTHQNWWHDYYPQSFITLNDPEKEAFYWIQMYKFASATRGDGSILDLMGPWYQPTGWPLIWGDLNVQLTYWTQLASNRLETGESLFKHMDKYIGNLRKMAPEDWENSMTIGPVFPQDLVHIPVGYFDRTVPDLLAWLCHNYWLQCSYAGDYQRMRDGLFPILKGCVNSYLNYLKENPVDEGDGKIHLKYTWSPEYRPGRGQDINFTIALLNWTCQTFLDLNQEHNLNDPLAPECQNILDKLVDYQVDENGLRIGKDIPFDSPHRHYSHLLGFYPLVVINPEDPEDRQLAKKSVDRWLDVSFFGNNPSGRKAVTGYTATGGASMYAYLGDGETAYDYLDYFIKHRNASTTTMYAENDPVIESPLSWATSLHDMLLQSWGGKVRVFPAIPEEWTDIAFHHLRTQGAFLVSAKRTDGKTQFVTVESLAGSPCIIQTDILNPRFYMNGNEISSSDIISKDDHGFYEIALNKGESVSITAESLKDTDMRIEALPVADEDKNLFGLSPKTARLPGHQFYYGERTPKSR